VHTPPALRIPTWFAMLQAFMVCGIPTGAVLTFVLWLGFGVQPLSGAGDITLQFFAMVSLLDTALIAMLIYVFLRTTGETSRDVFFGTRPGKSEAWLGLKLVPVVFLAVITVVVAVRMIFPSLKNVETSPFEAYLGNALDASIFLVVVVLAGGVREELQRAFILHRFDKYLGGVKLGLAIFSITFGLLHVDQGYDVALVIGLVGLLWGVLYVTRRSAVAPMVNHAAFNAAQVAQAVVVKTLGM
jgi:membrane protease YdiL (CAAX protease family)